MPVQSKVPITRFQSSHHADIFDIEVQKMLEKGAITVEQPIQGQFLSSLFMVPKKNGELRPVINLRPLNRFLPYQHFKMENITAVKHLLVRDDWLVTIDLKDAYFTVPIYQAHRKYLRFCWKGVIHQFTCMPFGLCSAPRTFTKILKPVASSLRERGIRCVFYLDDILIMGASAQDCLDSTNLAVNLLQDLGFIINKEKSHLTPTQQVEYLGFVVNSKTMSLSLSQDKISKIVSHCREVMSAHTNSVRDLASLIGKMSATIQAVFPAPLFYRHLQLDKIASLRENYSYETDVILSKEAKNELKAWTQFLHAWNGRAIVQHTPDLTIQTDASANGWGACLAHQQAGGRWTSQEKLNHINYLELLAVFYALKTLLRGRRDLHVRLQMDNSTAISYINHMGGTRSISLVHLALKIWLWCLQRSIVLTAEHLPGSMNVTADNLSRVFNDRAEWQLDPLMFQQVMSKLSFFPEVDLFATRLNAQLQTFVSWQPDPMAWRVDALFLDWGKLKGYAFPPFALLPRCLSKISEEKATIVLIAPVWRTQTWYPRLLEMAVRNPIILPKKIDLLRLPHNRTLIHPLADQMFLAAWRLSGKPSIQREFRSRCPSHFCHPGETSPRSNTIQLGIDGPAGVFRGKLILFEHL